jgi:amino acid transporter
VLRVDHAAFITRFNAFMMRSASLPDAYNSILRDAAANGMVLGQGWTWTASVLALPIAYLAFAGFTYSVYVGGEVRSPERSQVRGILGSLFVGSLVYFVVLGRYYAIAGQDFINALAFLNAQGKSPVPLGGSLLLQATMLTNDTLLQVLICIGFALWFFLLLFVMTQACVRVVFAWAMDRLAPFALTKVTLKSAAPSVATGVTLAVSAVGLVLNALGQLTFLNYIALFSVCFLIGGIAAVVFPSRNRRLFDRAPASARARLFGRVSVLRAAGVGNTILFTVVLLSALLHPGLSGVSGWKPWLFLAVVYVTGFIWYRVATTRSDAVDPEILYEELPPDVEESTPGTHAVGQGAAQA